VGSVSSAKKVTLTNNRATALTISKIFGGGTNPGDFRESNNCSSVVAPGGSCTITLSFDPTAVGSRSATVVASDNAANSPQNTSLSGTGTAPVTLSSTSIGFGNVVIGTSKSDSPVTLTNRMDIALTGINVAITGSATYTQTNTCGTSVPAHGTCTITVIFKPVGTGKQTGTVSITDSAINSPQTFSVTGTGELPVTVSPLTLSFGTLKVGTTSAPMNVTVTNNLSSSLTITSIGYKGSNPGDYGQTNTCGSSLAAGAHCTISATFSPKATGSRTATLLVTDSASTSPQAVKAIGTGN
jgi:hypothetical protein